MSHNGDKLTPTLEDHVRQLQDYIRIWANQHRRILERSPTWQLPADDETKALVWQPRAWDEAFAHRGRVVCHQTPSRQPQIDALVQYEHKGAAPSSVGQFQFKYDVPIEKEVPFINVLSKHAGVAKSAGVAQSTSVEKIEGVSNSVSVGLVSSYDEIAQVRSETAQVYVESMDPSNERPSGPSDMSSLKDNIIIRKQSERSSISRQDAQERADEDNRRSVKGKVTFNNSAPQTSLSHPSQLMKRASAMVAAISTTKERTKLSVGSSSVWTAMNSNRHISSRPSRGVCTGQKCMKWFVQHRLFEIFCACVIFVNAFMIGYAADSNMRNPAEANIKVVDTVELAFCIFYMTEVALRIYADDIFFFFGPDRVWNLFDFLLTLMGVADQVMNFCFDESALHNVLFLRTLRLMKALKIFRIVRLMVMFKPLRLILSSLSSCVKPMIWMCMFILVIQFMFSVLFLQGCISYLQDEENVNEEISNEIDSFWSSLVISMQSLFMATTGGYDWHEIAKPLSAMGRIYEMAFYFYISFFLFVVFNTLTSLFVEASLQNADKDYQSVIDNELEKKDMYVNKLQDWFQEIDTDDTGEISYEEFCAAFDDPRMYAFAASLEIDLLNAKQFFYLMSSEGQNLVDLQTFVVGCIKLKGTAKALDHQALIHAHRKGVEEQRKIAGQILDHLCSIERAVVKCP